MSRAVILAVLAAAFAAQPAAAQLIVDKRADLAAPVKLEAGQGAILVGFSRPDKMSMGKSGTVAFSRYDVETRDLVLQPRGAKKAGDTTTYFVKVRSADKKATKDHALMIVSEGDYVLLGATPGPAGQVMNSFCLGAPTFRVKAGEVVYFGDVTPYINVKLEDGRRTMAMAYSADLEAAKASLAQAQPALGRALKPAELRNEATYGCAGMAMMAYQVPGVPALEPLALKEPAAQ